MTASTDYLQISGKLTKKEFHSLLDELCEKYYNNEVDESEDIIDNDTYDKLVDIYKLRFGEKYKQIGAVPRHKEKVKLDHFLASLDKLKTEKEIISWTKNKKGPFIREPKLDGVSCEYVCKKVDGEWIYTLRTRGNGKVGTNISHLLEHLDIPRLKTNFACRGEIVMSRRTFEEKYKDQNANARNMVAGLVNSKHYEISEVKDLDVVMYQVLESEEGIIKPSEELELLEGKGFDVVINDEASKEDLLDVKSLIEHHQNWEATYKYEIDGTVIYENIAVEWPKNKNPLHAIAFKVNTYAIVTVRKVEYRKSRHGREIPRVWFDPVFLSGAKLEKATGHNANYIYKNNINVGSIIEVTRSGKVIPYIHRVIHSSDEPLLPEGLGETGNWDKNHTHIVNFDIDEGMEIKQIINFFSVMDVKYLGEKTIEKLYDAGFDTLSKLFSAKKKDFLEIDTFKDKSSQRIYDAIKQSITDVSLVDIMSASGCFGVGLGKRKLEPILDKYPNIMEMYENTDYDDLVQIIKDIKGYADISAIKFVDGLYDFNEFMESNREYISFEKDEEDDGPEITFETDSEDESEDKPKKESLNGKSVVFTGGKDKEVEKKIKKLGGCTKTSVSKNTGIVVTQERYSNSKKELDADRLGVPVYTMEEFLEKYIP